MATTEAQRRLYQALEAHKSDLEIKLGVLALDQDILERRIEDVQRLLEWVSQLSKLELSISAEI